MRALFIVLLIVNGCTNQQQNMTSRKYITFKLGKDINENNPLDVYVVATLNPNSTTEVINFVKKLGSVATLQQDSFTYFCEEIINQNITKWHFELVENCIKSYILVGYQPNKTNKCILFLRYNDKIKVIDLNIYNDRSIIEISQDDVHVNSVSETPADFLFAPPMESKSKDIKNQIDLKTNTEAAQNKITDIIGTTASKVSSLTDRVQNLTNDIFN